MKSKRRTLCFSIMALFATNASAQEVESTVEQKVAEVNARYAEEWAGVQQQGEAIKERAPEGAETVVGVDGDCEMKRQEIKLDIPEMSLNRKDMSLDLPQVSMKSHSISWDNPETVMRTTTCGYYPEFHGFEIKMKPIKCDLPQLVMVRREAKTDLPEFRWDKTEIKMDIPEFTLKTQRWAFDLPECKVKDVSVETKQMKEDSARLEARATELAGRQQSEIRALVASDLVSRRQQVDASFAKAVGELEEAIKRVRVYGIDPSRVHQDGGTPLNLVSQLTELQQRRTAELAKIDQSIASLAT